MLERNLSDPGARRYPNRAHRQEKGEEVTRSSISKTRAVNCRSKLQIRVCAGLGAETPCKNYYLEGDRVDARRRNTFCESAQTEGMTSFEGKPSVANAGENPGAQETEGGTKSNHLQVVRGRTKPGSVSSKWSCFRWEGNATQQRPCNEGTYHKVDPQGYR